MVKPSEHLPGVDSKSFRFCLCCHVKTGTLLYGIFIALGDILFLGLLTFITIHPATLTPQNQQRYDGIVLVQTDNGSYFQSFGYEFYRQQISKDNLSLMFGISLVCFISTLALIYGIARNVASYLMPFFCLQVFDFCLSCLVAVGCFTYAPNVKHWIHDQGWENCPGMNYLMPLDSNYLLLIFVIALILVLSIKAYFICMVWSCYKYIQLYTAARSAGVDYSANQDVEVLMPPCYEEAIKVPGNYSQPPAYSRE